MRIVEMIKLTRLQKIQGAQREIMEAILIRDLFGSILCFPMQQNIDMAEVLKYPLTPVPLCLSYVDGSVNSTPRSNLLVICYSSTIIKWCNYNQCCK